MKACSCKDLVALADLGMKIARTLVLLAQPRRMTDSTWSNLFHRASLSR